MLNAQVSKLNEWANGQCANTLSHCFIENSLQIENCQLIIVATKGAI